MKAKADVWASYLSPRYVWAQRPAGGGADSDHHAVGGRAASLDAVPAGGLGLPRPAAPGARGVGDGRVRVVGDPFRAGNSTKGYISRPPSSVRLPCCEVASRDVGMVIVAWYRFVGEKLAALEWVLFKLGRSGDSISDGY